MAKVLSGAVQVDTTVQDDWGVLSANSSDVIKKLYDDAFLPFEAYLKSAFPLVHEHLKKEVVDSHGLIYTWQGSDESLKPLILMAHQDVVPIEPSTAHSWTHPPFSGFIDEENDLVWGRGSSDDKSGLIGILAALESLLSLEGEAFAPRRTIVTSFGFDEESAGSAAEVLAAFLVDRYGKGGAELIVDEGAQIIGRDTSAEEGGLGVTFAPPATAEKGYMDVRVVVNTPGGHSSEPPPRTGIGYLSRLVVAIEDNPPLPTLDSLDHPALATLLCLRHSPAIKKRRDLSKALAKLSSPKLCPRKAKSVFKEVLAALSPDELDVFKTTQAVDLISGGVKINALPERSVATINFRVDVNTPSDDLRASLSQLVQKESKKLGLEYSGWKLPGDSVAAYESVKHGKDRKKSHLGSVHLELTYPPLEAAPRTPVSGEDANAWRLLSSVIRGTWKDTDGSEIPGEYL
jgi:Gly-Xaa carboxypeptidase